MMRDSGNGQEKPTGGRAWSRRQFLGMGSAAALSGGVAILAGRRARGYDGTPSATFLAKAADYAAPLDKVILEGLAALGVSPRIVHGKRILLKPNLVETALGQPHINTHPAVVVAAAEAFRKLDAREVIVAEGQGHRRDSVLVLDESGMGEALAEARLPFVDLNHDDCQAIPNKGNHTRLRRLHIPNTVLGADWVVSMPKLKTHHWTGVTAAMKNLFGIMPGLVYGWPKNVLHHQGIHRSIVDINATVRSPLAIVDGIIGMEGDGPIMGTAKHVGCLIMGTNPVAVDATCARVMGLNPFGVGHLKLARGLLGPVGEQAVEQRGEKIESVRTRFDVLDLDHLQSVRET